MNKFAIFGLFLLTFLVTSCGGGDKTPSVQAPAPIIKLTINNAITNEGDSGVTDIIFNVSVNIKSNNTITVDYATQDQTALAGEDYVATSGTLTFNPNERTKYIKVSVNGDMEYADNDGTETFNMLLSNASVKVTRSQATGTITNDDMTLAENLTQLKRIVREHSYSVNMWMYLFEIDLGADGDDDLVYLSAIDNHDLQEREYGMLAYFTNNKGGGFVETETDIVAFARDVEVADFNNDGYDDVFIAEYGYDSFPATGALNYLLLQNSKGGFNNVSDTNIPQVLAEWHGAASADIDQDGDIDIIATGLHAEIAIYVNNGNGDFTQDDSRMPSQDLLNFANDTTFYTWIKLIDLDIDGYPELIVGSEGRSFWYTNKEPNMPILRNEGDKFSFNDSVDLVSESFADDETITEMQIIDINLDGCDDLVTHGTDYIDTVYISMFKSDCNGGLEKIKVFTNNNSKPTSTMIIGDVNDDGLLDIYTGYYRYAPRNSADKAYINNGDGTFTEGDITTDMNVSLVTLVTLNL